MKRTEIKISEQRRGEEHNNFYHNTRLLLKLYRKVDFFIQDRVQSLEEYFYDSNRQDLQEVVLSVLEVDPFVNVVKIEESLIDTNVSILLLNLMDLALTRLENYPDKGEVYAELLKLKYFDSAYKTNEQISEMLNVSRSTYYRYQNQAVLAYSNMLFGYAIPEIKKVLEEFEKLPRVAESINPYSDTLWWKLRVNWD